MNESTGSKHFARRPPPDYTQRSVKLKLFLCAAAIMVVLAIAERFWNKQTREWISNIDHAAPGDKFTSRLDSAVRTASDPAGTFVAAAESNSVESRTTAVDPAQRAWDQGWKDVHARLSGDERSLLFEMLHAAMARRALAADRTEAAAQLIEHATRLWDDYQAAAFQSVADLKGDDQAKWIDVLRKVNERFHSSVVPALKALIDGRTPTEAEETALKQLQTTLVALAKSEIQDDTVVFRPAERDIWFYELGRIHDADADQLHKSSLGHMTYLQLAKQPADYRGDVVTIRGTVRMAYRVPAPSNDLGLKEYCVYWIHPAGGPDSPIVVYALGTPPGFPRLAERRDGRSTATLHEDVEVTGVFFKRCAYPGKGGVFTAPLLLANTPDWRQPAAAAPVGVSPIELAAAALGALLLAICVTAVLWKRSSISHRKAIQQRTGGFVELGPLKIGPSANDKIRELERQARGEETA
jgi:hypothetical protein